MHQFFTTFLLLLALSPELHGSRLQAQDAEETEDYVEDLNGSISVANGGIWGEWGITDMCPDGTHAVAFSLLVERFQGPSVIFDDTALNGIRLFCMNSSGITQKTYVESELGLWGNWTKIKWCPSGPLKGFQLNTEPVKAKEDNTAVNNIRFKCDTSILEGDGLDFGEWGDWSEECERGICGLKTKQEDYQWMNDDTALNDVVFFCC